MKEAIINCPDCKGKGKIVLTNSYNFGLAGVFTLGLLNFLDKASSCTWEEKCIRCDGFGKIKSKYLLEDDDKRI
jgi:DnaJ-class molecular chaperone